MPRKSNKTKIENSQNRDSIYYEERSGQDKNQRFVFLPYGLYIKDLDALITSDYHLGYEEALYRQGIYIPDVQLTKIKRQIKYMKDQTHAKNFYILGDIKHEFSDFTYSEFTEVKELIEFLENEFDNLYFVRGNHDNYIVPFLKKMGYEFHEFIVENDILFIHGDKSIAELGIDENSYKFRHVIMGHIHPSIVLEDSIKIRRKFKVGLMTCFENKSFYILPGMSFLSYGIEVRELLGSKSWPFISDDILLNSIPYIMQDDYCLEFPSLGQVLNTQV